jgi:hypothetical protein
MKTEITLAELNTIKSGLSGGMDIALAHSLVDRKIATITAQSNMAKTTWDAYCNHFGLTPEDFGRKFTIKSRIFEVVGLNPSAPAFPIRAKRLPDGREFRCPARSVR